MRRNLPIAAAWCCARFATIRGWFIEVEDTDAVFLKRKLTAIFKPFVQATGRRGGTGLGAGYQRQHGRSDGRDANRRSTHVGSCFRLQLRVHSTKTARKQEMRSGTVKS